MSVPPITINFMLACFTSPKPEAVLREAVWHSEAGRRTRQWLTDNGLIDDSNRATGRGIAWVKYVCATPLPISAWTLPDRQSTVEEDWEKPIQQAAE